MNIGQVPSYHRIATTGSSAPSPWTPTLAGTGTAALRDEAAKIGASGCPAIVCY